MLESGVTQNICKPCQRQYRRPWLTMRRSWSATIIKYPVWSPTIRKIAFPSAVRRLQRVGQVLPVLSTMLTTAEMQDPTEDFDHNAMNVVWSGNDMIYFIAPIEATHQTCRVSPSVGEVE